MKTPFEPGILSRLWTLKTPLRSGIRSCLRALRTPTPQGRSPLAMMLILLVLVPTTVLLGIFGIQDLTEALTYPGRITGAALTTFGILTLAGAAAVVDHWFHSSFPYSGTVALLGTFAALVANLMLLFETWKDGESLLYLVVWSLLAAGSACAVVMVYQSRISIPAPRRLAAAVIGSAVLAAANFGYEHLFQPTQRGAKPLISLSVGKAVIRRDRDAFAVPVDIKLENHSDVGFYMLGTEFHTMGEKVQLSPKDRLDKQWRTDAEQWSVADQQMHPLSRREIHQRGQLLAAQPWLSTGAWIEPGEKLTAQTVVQLPMTTPYDQLTFYATAAFARKDRLRLDQLERKGYTWHGVDVPDWVTQDKTNAVVFSGRVYENNAIDRHTRDARWVTVYWRFNEHGVSLSENIARKGEEARVPPGEETTALVARYGIAEAATGPYEQTLWDIKNRK
ncbi:hypothetical protein ACH4JS_11470 [Streptomyces sp. NPDC017638]|uniref:hypothetical protein n=1 Tax=Streptomyces sp. NPDC017638 TaxID=3365004 RepID=UPI0037B6E7CB